MPLTLPISFTKMEGLGNDFVVVDIAEQNAHLLLQPQGSVHTLASAMCDRRLGIGGDGVLVVRESEGASGEMIVLNSDGSVAEMCGNGLRCVAKFLGEKGSGEARELSIATGAGTLSCELFWDKGFVSEVRIDMGVPQIKRAQIPMLGAPEESCWNQPFTFGEKDLHLSVVSMGNPHAIAFVEESGPALRALAEEVGPAIETSDLFPQKTNVEFARVKSPLCIELVVWERGVGITQACGTGACATVVAACKLGHCQFGTEVEVQLLGGSLFINAEEGGAVWMRGPTSEVFRGEYLHKVQI